MDLSLSNVINTSVAGAQTGAGKYNTSNLAIFTRETAGGGFGNLGYKLYLDAVGPSTDFTSTSATAQMAAAIFGQQPNILLPGGYLAVIPFLAGIDQQQTISFGSLPASGSFIVNYDGALSAPINWNDTTAAIQTKLRSMPGLGKCTVTGTIAGESLVVTLTGVGGNPGVFTISSNTVQTAVPAAVAITVAITTVGTNETLDAAITRTLGLVQYFGILAAEITNKTTMLAAAAVVQTVLKLAGFPSWNPADILAGGKLDALQSATLPQNRGLFINSSGNGDLDALLFAARYFGSALSVDFTGNNTTKIMHLKTLIGQVADPLMTQTQFALAQAAGADVYVSLGGVPKIFSSGINMFFDRIYNQLAFAGDLTIAYFNLLAQTDTKIVQTEDGMKLCKGSQRQICQQYRRNQYLAPGTWTSPTTFGNQSDFLRNILDFGYFIYSAPIALQSASDRAARKAPLIQIAAKEAGAVQSGNVLININP